MSTLEQSSAIRIVPNGLTVLRIALVPAFAATVLAIDDATTASTQWRWQWLALATFTVAMLTDYLDGLLARRWRAVTPFGQLVDPIADKAVTGVGWIGLAFLGWISWWIAIVLLARELAITLLRMWLLRGARARVLPANRGGKLKTALQTLTISWYLLPWPALSFDAGRRLGPVLLTITVLVTLVSGAAYFRDAVRRG